jgi:hypothetical protein
VRARTRTTHDTNRSGVYLPDEPNTFQFCIPQVFCDVKFAGQGKQEEGEDHNGLGEEGISEVEEIWQAITELDAKLKILVDTLRINWSALWTIYGVLLFGWGLL